MLCLYDYQSKSVASAGKKLAAEPPPAVARTFRPSRNGRKSAAVDALPHATERAPLLLVLCSILNDRAADVVGRFLLEPTIY